MTHPLSLDNDELLKLCKRKNFRDSGPGGQHRNKVETGVELTHQPSKISARASERRQQAENLSVALKRLRIELALNFRSNWQQASPLWQSRCVSGKIIVSTQHHDFASLLCECLDVLEKQSFDLKKSSEMLSVTSSQMIKFLKKNPKAFQRLNQTRLDQNKAPYK
jgi:hypothetical protein